jgi:hypothetical protein
MIAPFTFHPDYFPRGGSHDASYHGHKVSLGIHLHFRDGVTVLVVSLGYPLDLALEVDKHKPPFPYRPA